MSISDGPPHQRSHYYEVHEAEEVEEIKHPKLSSREHWNNAEELESELWVTEGGGYVSVEL